MIRPGYRFTATRRGIVVSQTREIMRNDKIFARCVRFITAFSFCVFVCLAVPQISEAHALNGSLTGRYNTSVERWRPVIRKYLKHYRIYSKDKEGRLLHIIKHESGGSPHARNGRHAGLVQFTPSWKHDYSRSFFRKLDMRHYHSDNRLSGRWSIWRICKAWKQGGTSNIKRHWAATYWR